MKNFVKWIRNAEYTPFGNLFDVGNICYRAIAKYELLGDIENCGCDKNYENGNGSLMRILPACLYFYIRETKGELSGIEAIKKIHEVSALTHAHDRSLIACGLYYFMVKSILDNKGILNKRLQLGLQMGFQFYEGAGYSADEIYYFQRLRNLEKFSLTYECEIKSSGYVVDTLEAAV